MNELEPGSELDALVAEKVMGESRPTHPPNDWQIKTQADSAGGNWFAGTTGYQNGDEPIWIPCPFSRSIASAWKIIEHDVLLETLHLRHSGQQGEWEASFCAFPGTIGHGQTAPHAICLAALRAIGVSKTAQTRQPAPV